MRRLALACLGTLLVVVGVASQERIDLTTPEASPSNTGYRLQQVTLVFDYPATASVDEGAIEITLASIGRDERLICRYNASTTPTATFLLNALQKSRLDQAYAGNATTGSLKQRIYHRLLIMGEATAVCGRSLAGSLAGTVP